MFVQLVLIYMSKLALYANARINVNLNRVPLDLLILQLANVNKLFLQPRSLLMGYSIMWIAALNISTSSCRNVLINAKFHSCRMVQSFV
jgi:hypothetical protein